MADLAEKLYEGSAEVGSLYAYFSFIFAFLIALCMSSSSIYLFTSDESNLVNTKATIVKTDCKEEITYDSKNRPIKTINCILDVEYQVDDKKLINKITASGVYNINQIIDITYDKNNPNQVNIKGMSSKTMAIVLCVIGVIILLCSYANYYLTQKSKVYASIQGVTGTFDIARNVLRN